MKCCDMWKSTCQLSYIPCSCLLIIISVFPLKVKEKDLELHNRLKALQSISHIHFEVKEEYVNEELCRLAAEGNHNKKAIEFKNMEEAMTPHEMLEGLIKVSQMINSAITVYSGTSSLVSADESSPLMIYLLFKYCPKHPYSALRYVQVHCSYVENFRSEDESEDDPGEYCLLTLKASIGQLEQLCEAKAREVLTCYWCLRSLWFDI
eukprot:TRINITY_DN14707_c0_g1_i1.p1 TRINITY_DN14707_c0_g1~~TRINITY_DN14707_c0_g1_i1.p1  ORF type:complete len:207 (-),score=23.90 TRINITY_DN14707_c0_g1_i1:2-622(-)